VLIGIDAWGEYDACIAVQYAEQRVFPKVTLVNKTTYHEHFEDISVETPQGENPTVQYTATIEITLRPYQATRYQLSHGTAGGVFERPSPRLPW